MARPRGAAAAVRYEMVRRSCRIELGAAVSFAAGAGGARYLSSGWSRPDAQGVWSDGPTAKLLFDVGGFPHDDLALELELRPFLAPDTAARRVEISAGNGPPAPIELGTAMTLALPIPASSFRASMLTVDFCFDDPASPLSAGLSDDARELSVMLVSARLRPAD
jgi:hypothetical protein